MTLNDLEILARRELSDEAGSNSCRFVTSEQICAYANEAENEACRRARLLVDSSTEAICRIPVVAGTAVYPFDERIIFIKRGIMAGGTRPLNKASHVTMDELCPGWENKAGVAETFVTGLYSRQLQLYKVPTVDDVLKLTVIRTPLAPMVKATDSPEIPTRFHLPLILWIKHKVFNIQDSEVLNMGRADTHLAEFEKYFGKRCAVDEVFDEMLLLRTDEYGDDGGGYY